MNFFTRQWWFIDSVSGDILKKGEAFFKQYDVFVEGLVKSGVPVQKELSSCCSLHDHVITRVSFNKSSLDLVVRNGDGWVPYLLSFPHPEKVVCTGHGNGEEYCFFDLADIVDAGIGYSEYGAFTRDNFYIFSMIFDHDFSIDIELSGNIRFCKITDEQAGDNNSTEQAS